jgi:hypothetical protein
MKGLVKFGPLLVVALLAIAAVGVSAQAQTFEPDNTAVSGTANDPTLNYGDAVVTCDTGTVTGMTGTDSNLVDDALVNFQEPCNISGILDATVACEPGTDDGTPVDLIAQDATNNTGTVELEDTFNCTVSVAGLCNIEVQGPQTTQDNNLALDTTADTVTANVDVQATNDGSEACGPPSGTGGFDAVYATTPANLDIVP